VRRRRKILYVHHRPELGGAPTSLYYFLLALDKEEFEPHVFCPPGPAAALFESAGAVVRTGPVAGFTHIWASTYRGRRWLLFVRELSRLPQHLRQLRATLRDEDFELIHLNDSPLVPAAWVAKRHGVPIVWHLRSALPGDGRDVRSRFLRRAIRRLAARAIAINEDVAAVFDVDAEVVPNSVDLDRFHPGEAPAPDERPTIAFFGFIYPSKGFRQFIQAARLIRDQGIDADYVVVGGAVRGQAFFRTPVGRALKLLGLAQDYELEAARLVDEHALEGHVRFVPFTRDTAALYRTATVVVAPSRGPELGRPVIEAAASGVPVIATGSRTGGGVIVPDETGLLAPDSDASGLAEAISALVRDPERRRRLGEAARRHAETQFDPIANARSIEEIYRRVAPTRDRIPILFVHHRPQLGGAPSSLAELIRNLDARYEPHVFVPPGPAADLFESVGATVHLGRVAIFAHAWDSPYEGLRWLVLGRELASLPEHLRGLGRLLREERFPIVHLNDSPLLAAAALAHRSGARVVWHLRSALAGEGRDARARAISALIDRWGDAAIAIDADVAARFPIRLKTTIVHNSVRLDSVSRDREEARAQFAMPADRVAVGFAGFVRRQKGWPELVAAARRLVDEGSAVHFVIIGGGVRPPEYFRTPKGRLLEGLNVLTDEESAIRDLVRREGLEDHFSFLPFTPETGGIYGALDIITFPNQGVGLGRPVLEAAAHGRPVVASGSSNGAGLLVPEVTGILLQDPTPDAIAGALRRLIDDPELRARMGTAAAEHARENFDPTRNARAVERVYASLLGLDEPAPEPTLAEPTPV
jgi:glycosyltransferase involved in cell wall biosynthesis